MIHMTPSIPPFANMISFKLPIYLVFSEPRSHFNPSYTVLIKFHISTIRSTTSTPYRRTYVVIVATVTMVQREQSINLSVLVDPAHGTYMLSIMYEHIIHIPPMDLIL